MLNRAIASPSLTPAWWAQWRRGLTAKHTALLLRYVVILASLCMLGCIYLAQMNIITNLISETTQLNRRAVELEGVNVILMRSLAELESPATVAEQAAAWDFGPSGASAIIRVSLQPAAPAMRMASARPLAQIAELLNKTR